MKRRARASGKTVKTRRRKAVALKRRNAPKAAPRSSPSAASQDTEVARLIHDLTEALEQQSATADVLHMISRSPSDIQPVLEAIVRIAGELCAAEYSILFRLRDGKYHVGLLQQSRGRVCQVLLGTSNQRGQRLTRRPDGSRALLGPYRGLPDQL